MYYPEYRAAMPFIWGYKHLVFSETECESIIEYGKNQPLSPALVGNGNENTDIRRSKIRFVERTDDNAWFMDRFASEVMWLNDQFFHFDLWGCHDLQYGEYDSTDKGTYDWHIDSHFGIPPNLPYRGCRKLSAVMVLNSSFEGGQFQIALGNQDKPEIPEMMPGTLVVFPSFLVHRVTEVVGGTRCSLVAWYMGPKFT